MIFNNFLQHKGSDLCIDIVCPNCKDSVHIDGDFLYQWECKVCKTLYNMGDFLVMQEAKKGEEYFNRERYK